MNIMNKLTIRHLKKNKRRTLVTIIGVIISVAMVTAVATLGVSFIDLLKRQTIATDGEWHVQYEDVQSNQLTAIEQDRATKKLIISNDKGYARIEEPMNENKPYFFIKEYNQQGMHQFPIELIEGNFPQAENEVILSKEITADAEKEYELGDQFTLEIGDRFLEGEGQPLSQQDSLQKNEQGTAEELKIETTETFTVVGFMERPTWEPAWSPAYTIISYVNQPLLKEKETVDAVVVLHNVNQSLFDHAEQLAAEIGVEEVTFNNELLRYHFVTEEKGLQTTLFSLMATIILVILIGSVSLIYNAFAISVSERSRHLGMLSSIGATKKQKRNSVFFEGAIIGLISIPIGILAGIAGMAVTFLFINSYLEGALNLSENLKVVVTPISILAACLISIITIFVSTYMPARKASRISAIDAIRQTEEVKLSGKAVKTSGLVRKLFGMEGELGLKNLKRNKRRYQVTVFSLVISIVLFLSVSFFTSSLEKSVEMSQEEVKFDIQVSGSSPGDMEELSTLTNLNTVTGYSMNKSVSLRSYLEEANVPERLQEKAAQGEISLSDGKYPYYIDLVGLGEESFREYAKKAGVDPEKLQTPENPAAIVVDHTSYQDVQARKFIETDSIEAEPGERIDLYSMDYDTGEETFMNEVIIGALTDHTPMGVRPASLGGLTVVVSHQTMNQLVSEEVDQQVNDYLYLNSSDPMATQETLEEAIPADMYVYNVYQRRQEDKQLLMIVSVFTYGFIALITAISIANIFNTISTGISLRKREFAMLKSIGMTPKGFNKMIHYESVFYGIKSLLYGLPISIIIMALIYWAMSNTFVYPFTLPWMSIMIVVAAIFIIVSAAMLYSIKKIKKENIIEGLQQENI